MLLFLHGDVTLLYYLPIDVTVLRYLAGDHGDNSGKLAERTGPPRVCVDDVTAPIVRVHGPDDQHVHAHQEIRHTQVDDEE